MKNPSSILRYSFIAAIGFLLVGILFTIIGWPEKIDLFRGVYKNQTNLLVFVRVNIIS
jgi:hypothetical protein